MKERFGLHETRGTTYPLRTRFNVECTSATLLVGDVTSAGSKLTLKNAAAYGKESFVLPYGVRSFEADMVQKILDLYEWLKEVNPERLNVAGNRESKNPGIQEYTRTTLIYLVKELKA